MRKVFAIIILLFSISTYSQVNMEKVLIEMGTATWNNACASEVAILEELKNQGLDIAIINYHLNDPFANQYSNSRAYYYGMQSVPFPVVQGTAIESGDLQNYIDAYEEAINQNSSFVISLEGGFNGDTLFLEARVQKVASIESDTLMLHIALVESNIDYEWLQQTQLHQVERYMAPNATGTYLNFSESDTLINHLEIIFNEYWNPSEMELIAFVQNDTSKQVLQCHSLPLTQFAPLPVHAFFQAEDTIICRETAITFENYSTGDVETYEWYFEGGNPETSNEQFPTVTYNEAGEFDVRLIVQNSISLDTTFRENYMEILELPAISFSSLPEFCQDDPPYELTEGWPSDGHYFGLFVDTGYFHPSTAGMGSYDIYFSYQDSISLCSDTLTQTALVNLCSGINQLDHSLIKTYWIEDELHILSTSSKTSLSIYSLSGQLLDQMKLTDGNSIWKSPHSQNCFVLHFKNEENQWAQKTCKN